MGNKNKPQIRTSRYSSRSTKVRLPRSRKSFKKYKKETLVSLVRDMLLNGTPLKGSGKVTWKSFEGALSYLPGGSRASWGSCCVSAEVISRNLNVKKCEVENVFRLFNQEGWLGQAMNRRLPDGGWVASGYRLRLEKIK